MEVNPQGEQPFRAAAVRLAASRTHTTPCTTSDVQPVDSSPGSPDASRSHNHVHDGVERSALSSSHGSAVDNPGSTLEASPLEGSVGGGGQEGGTVYTNTVFEYLVSTAGKAAAEGAFDGIDVVVVDPPRKVITSLAATSTNFRSNERILIPR